MPKIPDDSLKMSTTLGRGNFGEVFKGKLRLPVSSLCLLCLIVVDRSHESRSCALVIRTLCYMYVCLSCFCNELRRVQE